MSESCVRPPDSTSTATSTPTTPPTTPAPGTASMGSLLEKLKRDVSLGSLGKNLLTSKLKNLSTYSPQTNLKPSTPNPTPKLPPKNLNPKSPVPPTSNPTPSRSPVAHAPLSPRALRLWPWRVSCTAMHTVLILTTMKI